MRLKQIYRKRGFSVQVVVKNGIDQLEYQIRKNQFFCNLTYIAFLVYSFGKKSGDQDESWHMECIDQLVKV